MTTIMDRGLLLLASATVVGVALVAAGWVIQGSAYVPGLLMQLGTSMMLLVPLALLGFILNNRLRSTEEQLKATVARLDTLTSITRDRLATNRRQRDQMFALAKRTLAQDSVRALLSEAAQLGAVDSSGARVRMSGTSLRVRFEPKDLDIQLHIEEPDGIVIGDLAWKDRESAEIFAQRLAEYLRSLDRYPGDSIFDPTTTMRQLLEALEFAVNARTGENPQDVGHLIEIPNQQWAVSAEGLFSLQHHYHIPASRIINSHDDWSRHMRAQSWVDITAFDEAYMLARQLLSHRNG